MTRSTPPPEAQPLQASDQAPVAHEAPWSMDRARKQPSNSPQASAMRRRRQALGLSVAAVACQLKIKADRYRGIEVGATRIRPEELLALVPVLRLSQALLREIAVANLLPEKLAANRAGRPAKAQLRWAAGTERERRVLEVATAEWGGILDAAKVAARHGLTRSAARQLINELWAKERVEELQQTQGSKLPEKYRVRTGDAGQAASGTSESSSLSGR